MWMWIVFQILLKITLLWEALKKKGFTLRHSLFFKIKMMILPYRWFLVVSVSGGRGGLREIGPCLHAWISALFANDEWWVDFKKKEKDPRDKHLSAALHLFHFFFSFVNLLWLIRFLLSCHWRSEDRPCTSVLLIASLQGELTAGGRHHSAHSLSFPPNTSSSVHLQPLG